jgi:two-component system phosphate regulon sensor histidine kinase PhoR
MSRIQLKIMGALTGLILLVVGASGVLVERGLRERTTATIKLELEHQAKLFAQLVSGVRLDAANADRLQAITRAASDAVDVRITVIDASGRIIADSDVPFGEIEQLANHADRPEVIEAGTDGFGYGIRRSDTLKRELLYVALRLENPTGRPGFVRLSVDLDQLDKAAADLRRELVLAGLMGLVVALGLSYGLSLLSLRPISELREVVMDIAEGKLERRLRWESKDERGEIAASINRLARQLRDSADEAMREKTQLEAVLSSMVEGVLVIDREGRVLLVNPRAQEMLSIWGDWRGRPVPEIIRFAEVDQALQDAADSDGLVVRELQIESDKKRTLLMHATGFPQTDPRDGTVAVFHDVSELRRVDAVRRDFIANASHELRTPLTSIQGFSDTLAKSDVSLEQRAQYLDVIARNARRMSALIDDLLTLSRIEGGRFVLEPSELDVRRVVETVLEDFQPRFAERAIEAHLHAGAIPACFADHSALEQILSNLLSNAARYSNAGSRLDLTLEPIDGFVEFRVRDTGIGIPKEDLGRIFERFYRVDASRSRALGSTGLGLSIVKHLVSAMGGEIRVESEPGNGSEFTFTLPSI